MPIDTRSKRASSVQMLVPSMVAPVFPNGAITQNDRQHIAWAYSGILAGPPTPVSVRLGRRGGKMLGYDKMATNFQMLLDLRLAEGVGVNTQDWAKAHHLCTLVGTPTWQALANDLGYLDFVPGNPDYVRSLQAATADLDFTTGDFSLAAWIRPDALGNRNIFARGLTLTDGWQFWLNANGAMVLTTSQAAVDQHTTGSNGDVVVGTWVLVGCTRSGAACQIYTNGVDTTGTPAVHIDPLTAARNLYIGVNNLAGAGWYDGDMWRPRILGRQLSAAEMLTVFERERDLFDV